MQIVAQQYLLQFLKRAGVIQLIMEADGTQLMRSTIINHSSILKKSGINRSNGLSFGPLLLLVTTRVALFFLLLFEPLIISMLCLNGIGAVLLIFTEETLPDRLIKTTAG